MFSDGRVCLIYFLLFPPSFLSAISLPHTLVPLPSCSTIRIAQHTQARRIQESGCVFAERILTDAQNDCYWFTVLLEWGALWGEG
jgi:hypothetical protein